MTPQPHRRPLYRWTTFWLGLFILAFFCWASVRSIAHIDYLGFMQGRNSWSISNQSQRIQISRYHNPMLLDAGFRGFNYHSSRLVTIVGTPRQDPALTSVSIPHWQIGLLFLIPWTAFLAWRMHHIRHHAAATAGLPHSANDPGTPTSPE